MADTRELTMDDYLAMARRRLKVVIVPLLIAPIAGVLVSYAFPPKYTSTSQVLVEGQKVPDAYVHSVVTTDFTQRVETLKNQILSTSRLQPMIQGLDLAKPGDETSKLMDDIRATFQVSPAPMTSMSAAAAAAPQVRKKLTATDEPVPVFNVSYTDSNPGRAQKITNAMASLMLEENLKSRGSIARDTTTFLSGQVAAAKSDLDAQDAKMAAFKRQFNGQLPGDIENNMRMLMSLNTQLDATTQNLGRAQQDKAYAESTLSQQISAWKSSQSSANPQTLEQQLAALQTQLLQLQARYTDDYPDVAKTKADISKVQAKLDEINKKANDPSQTSEKANANEPPEIAQNRFKIHQYQQLIEQYASDQKKLQASINDYERRTAMSPDVEQQYKQLSRDYDNAQAVYRDLLQKQSQADLGTSMETAQQGEQMTVLLGANRPEQPTFPTRPLFAAGGLGAGLGLGLLLAIFLEFSDKSIRTERDAAVAMDLPLLISVPWVGPEAEESMNGNGNGSANGRRKFWGRSTDHTDEKVGV
ncbi:MAG: Wzz/FepE/Etk N-terminal domain-containing protein [Terriglobales bacterium]